ncbi:ComEC/Rec2 family competence protein [Plantactinospora sp. GCM10030261]|uniref:ComEC/Rec2 family competence protein n=1 Tax=Plantactinospora sp. GCM10030261 TaxID=3273420 RepID=UPI003605EF6B
MSAPRGGARRRSTGDPTPEREPPDLRLAGLAVATWLSALLALRTALPVSLAIGGGAAVLAAVVPAARSWGWRIPRRSSTVVGRRWAAFSARWRGTGWRWPVVAVLLGVVCGSAATAARIVVRDAPALAGPVSAEVRVTAELMVRDDPHALRGASGRPASYLVPAALVWLRAHAPDARPVRAPARVLVLATGPAWRSVLPGQRVLVTARLGVPNGGDLTAAVLSVNTAPALLGEPSWAQRAAGRLRSGLQTAAGPLPDEPGGLLPGLVVGDTSRLDPAVEEDFRTTGMTHLTAVSGSNVAIVVGLVLLLARWARAGPWLSAGLCAVALVGFVVLARPSPSVLRAAAMGAVALLALATGRTRAALPALCTAVTVLVVLDPDLAGDPGFALSVLATSGLLLLAPRWRDGLRRRGVPAGLAESLAVPAAAQLACTPVIAGLSGTVSLVAVPANLLAVPAVAPATVLGVVAATVSPVWAGAAEFAAWLAGWPAWWLVLVARYGAQLPAGTLPWPGGAGGGLLLAGLTLLLMLAARSTVVRRLMVVMATAAVVGAAPIRIVATGWPPSGWIAVACDVGQGDALVLAVGPDQAVVVDAGPEPVAVDRCLRRLGVRSVPLLIVSHFHADHVGGVAGVFRGRRVGGLLTPRWPEPGEGRRLVERVAATAGLHLESATAGRVLRVGGAELTVLGPAHPARGTRSDPNNNSLVLGVRSNGLRLLLAGDAESEQQRALLDLIGPDGLRADVLKVAHHGSAYQEPEFLDRVDPTVALVSVGVDNEYGHPSDVLLARLVQGGSRVLRTDRGGDLAVLVKGGRLAVAVRGHPASTAGSAPT